MISIIVAIARKNAIGRGGTLPFHIGPDLRHFKELTVGKPIIMGRKTFESLPNGALPGRRNIVITRQGDYRADNIETVPSLNDALAMASGPGEIMIIGGGEVYRQALPVADRIYLTEVDTVVEGADTFFPAIPPTFATTDETPYSTDPGSLLSYRFVTLDKVTPATVTLKQPD